MGWASGSGLFSRVIEVIQENVEDHDDRVAIYEELIEAFSDSDWDTQDECLGEDKAYDEALYNVFPEWKDEEDDEDGEL